MSKRSRRGTQAQELEEEELRTVVEVSEPRVNLRTPSLFNGEGADLETIAGEYSSWKVAVNIWFDAVKQSGVKMNSRTELNHKMLMLSGQALLKAHDAVTYKESATWKDVEAHLDAVYLGCINPQAIIATLRNVKQSSGQSVAEYAAKWNAIHRRLVSIGVSNRDVASQWFVDGLLPNLQRKVNEKLLEDQPLTKYELQDINGAISCVTNIAQAKELTMGRNNGGTESRWQPRGRGWSTVNSQRNITAQINSLATDFAVALGVDAQTVSQRLRSKECLSCGSKDHRMSSCPKVRKAKLNSMTMDDDHEKNE
jgi:hypothetical protein